MLFLFIIFALTLESHLIITSANSKSIVKSLPGFSGDLPFTFETGYIGVGEDEEVQAFYYFLESERNPSEDPVVYHLSGGPGTSGLFSFLYEIGPLNFNLESSWKNNLTLDMNPYSWTKVVNLILVDLPAGVGFSYAKTWEASRSGDSILASHTYEFMRKWFMEHPTFVANPLYISGTSYMGIIAPIVALKTYKSNERGIQPQLNIKGFLLTSPLTNKFTDFNSRLEFAHRLALISDVIYESAKETCLGNYIYNDPQNSLCSDSLQRVDECVSQINLANVLEPLCDTAKPEPICRESTSIFVDNWGSDKDVQKALNVREGTIESFEYANMTIHYLLKKKDTIYYKYDIFSSIPYHKELASKNCQVLILSGDHDMTFPYLGMEKWIKNLNLSIETPWKPWFVRSQVAGYDMTYAHNGYTLKFATVKGAGHAVPWYKPKETLIMLDRWFGSHTYSNDS